MAAARAKPSGPPLEPCGCLVLLEFDDPRRARLDERALYAALLDLGVRPSNGEVFAPQDGALACVWFFCPTATAADSAAATLRRALLQERLPMLCGAKVSAFERRSPSPAFDVDGMEAQFAAPVVHMAVADGWFVTSHVAPPAPAGFPPLPPPQSSWPWLNAARPYSPTAATPHASQSESQERPRYTGLQLPAYMLAPPLPAQQRPMPPPPPLPPPPPPLALPPGFSTRLPGALPVGPGGPAVWEGHLMMSGSRVCSLALRPEREAEAQRMATLPWPAVLRDEKRCSVAGLLAGSYGPMAPALAPLAWAEAAEPHDTFALAKYCAAMEARGNAPIIALGDRWELVLLPLTPQVAAMWTLPTPAPGSARRLLAVVLPARWAGRVEAVTQEGVVKASAAAHARPCDSRGAPVALPDVLRLTIAAPLERVPRVPGAAAACFAIAGRDGDPEHERLTELSKMARRSSSNGKAACALLPLAGLLEAAGAQEKLWLFPEPSGPGGGFRYAALLQRDATSRGLLKLL